MFGYKANHGTGPNGGGAAGSVVTRHPERKWRVAVLQLTEETGAIGHNATETRGRMAVAGCVAGDPHLLVLCRSTHVTERNWNGIHKR